MLSRKRTDACTIELHQKNIEFSSAEDEDTGKASNKRNIVRRPFSAGDDVSTRRWPDTSSKYKMDSTDNVATKPKYIAFMSKSGSVSAEIRRHVRPASAQPCATQPRKAGYLFNTPPRKRFSHSAGPTRNTTQADYSFILEKSRRRQQLTNKSIKTRNDVIESLGPDFMMTRNRSLGDDNKHARQINAEYDITAEHMDQKTNRLYENSQDVVSAYVRKESKRTEENHKMRNNYDRTDKQTSLPDPTRSIHQGSVRPRSGLPQSVPRSYTKVIEMPDAQGDLNKEICQHSQSDQFNYKNILILDNFFRENLAVGKSGLEAKKHVVGLFRKAALFVRSILRLQIYMTDLSAQRTTRSATEEQWHAVHNSQEVKEMAFNKAVYAKSKAVSKIPKWARLILDKPPDDRADKDLRRLHALLRGLKSFDRFTEQIQLAMCRSFTYQWSTSGRIILRQGHIGQNFYFLYIGSVFVNIDDRDIQGNQFVKTEVVLKKGDSFGELALLQDIRRTATITCREDCEMLVVDKDTFAKACPRIFEKELEEKCDFLEKLDMFSPKLWTREALKKMCFEARIQEYKTNKVIVSDSSVDDYLYICMEGKCNVIRRLDLKEEIDWRKKQRREAEKNLPVSDDVIDLIGIMGIKSYSAKAKEDTSHEEANLQIGKERMLHSMGLDYTKSKRLSVDDITKCLPGKRQPNRGAKSEDAKTKEPEDVPQTLTALIAREKRNNILFLDIKTIGQNDIFDIYSLLNQINLNRLRSYILVSQGSRILRIKQKSFFKEATTKAILQARSLAEFERYPEDEKLLHSYMEHLNWKIYKHSMLDKILRNKDHDKKQTRHSIALQITSKENARNMELLNALNQAFYEYDPNLRRIAKWKQMQEMAQNVPQLRETEEIEMLTGIRMHGSLIPELQIDIREELISPKRSIHSKRMLGAELGFIREDEGLFSQLAGDNSGMSTIYEREEV